MDKELTLSQCSPAENDEAIQHLKQAIASGTHWYIALLEAIGLWTKNEEVLDGRVYRYLIAGEAFDWLLLAERLCEAVDGLLPSDDKIALLFHGKPPLELPRERLKEIIGSSKYHQYLNYFYGVTVEETLTLAVQEEVRKEKLTSGYTGEQDTTNEVYQRIYGATRDNLLRQSRQEKGYPQRKSIGLTELKEFAYWRFKYRLNQCDKAKVASDTKKALERLRQQWVVPVSPT
ncbi:MAG: hypothetical protein JSW30_04920 [Dehalococcoidia bacterium]|nr:MAG: hypothetical protein JSW30_04920 [Dehalococcoidia bacterium]